MTLDTAFVIRCVLAALSVYRVAMFTREDGPFWIFAFIRALLGKKANASEWGHGGWWTLAELSNCPHCAGVWWAFVGSVPVVFPSYYSDVLLVILAIAGLQSILTGRSDDQ